MPTLVVKLPHAVPERHLLRQLSKAIEEHAAAKKPIVLNLPSGSEIVQCDSELKRFVADVNNKTITLEFAGGLDSESAD